MFRAFVSLVSFVVISAPIVTQAQTADLVGVRALGMAGAFTAVADDATATWWNPAGLAGGAYFSAILEFDRPRTGSDQPVRGLSAAFPALGLSYYRLPLSQLRPATSTDATVASRQHEGVLSVYGASVGQSLGNHLVIGSTLKLARAGDTQGGLDVGAMASFGRTRLGLMVRNFREIEFDSATPDAWRLRRQARAGAAFTTGSRGVIGRATLAVDADLTKTAIGADEDRRFAAGGEIWTTRRVVGIRGGVSASTIGDRRTSLSGGFSVSVRSSAFVDAHVSSGEQGSDRRGWGVDLRVTF
jgi:F plasmid transfer operon protein TraF